MKFDDYIQLKDLATIEFSKYKIRFIDEVESNRLFEKRRIVAIPKGYYFDVLIPLVSGRYAEMKYDPDIMFDVFNSIRTIKQSLPQTINITHVQMETKKEIEENLPPKNNFMSAVRYNGTKMTDILRIRIYFDDVSHQVVRLLSFNK